jgi:aconitate hydratase
MGAELGATTSVFPSDEVTKSFLMAQGREDDWREISADDDAVYDEVIDIDLSKIEPLAAMPHSPDNVKPVREIGKIRVDQVCIGSCTNSSLSDMLKVAAVLKGKKTAPNVSLSIAPGSMQVLNMLALNGALSDMIGAGARILESACGPCIGMGQSPNSGGISLRTFNRNFEGRSGTADAGVYLVSPEVAAASAISGVFTDPRTLGVAPEITIPKEFVINDNLIELPSPEHQADDVDVLYGPNIKPFPTSEPLAESICATAILKVSDNITTDHIMPAGAKILPYRSNIPYLSQFCFAQCDPDFADNCKAQGKGIIVGGTNYGQGSSREHAALVPLYLGIKAVVTKSFARIHCANLINAGIVPLTFENADDYSNIDQGDELCIPDIKKAILNNEPLVLKNMSKDEVYRLSYEFSKRQRDILIAGGLLNYTKQSV